MSQIKVKIDTPEQMQELGYIIASSATPSQVIALVGDLGAGKTTLTKGIGKYLGVSRTINSPTFTIMKVYDTTHQTIKKLYHLDVYRLTDSTSDFELEEYFYLDGLTVIEWANIIDDILPPSLWEVEITNFSESARIVKINASDNLIKQIEEKKYEIIH